MSKAPFRQIPSTTTTSTEPNIESSNAPDTVVIVSADLSPISNSASKTHHLADPRRTSDATLTTTATTTTTLAAVTIALIPSTIPELADSAAAETAQKTTSAPAASTFTLSNLPAGSSDAGSLKIRISDPPLSSSAVSKSRSDINTSNNAAGIFAPPSPTATSQSSSDQSSGPQLSTMFIVVIVVAVVAVIGAIAAVSARRRNSGDSGNNRKRHKRTKKISEDSQAGQAAGQMLSNRRFAVRASTASGEYLADSEYEDNADERSEENSGVGGVKMTGQLKHQNIASKRQRLENFGVHDFGASNQEEISDEDGGSDNYRHSFELAHESRRILVQRNFHEPPMAVVVRDNAHVVAVDTTPEFFNTAGSCAHISTS